MLRRPPISGRAPAGAPPPGFTVKGNFPAVDPEGPVISWNGLGVLPAVAGWGFTEESCRPPQRSPFNAVIAGKGPGTPHRLDSPEVKMSA